MADRVSQDVAEVSASGTPKARTSQDIAEVSGSGTPKARVSQDVGEVSGYGTPKARLSQNVGEVSGYGSPFARIGQVTVSILVRSIDVAMPPVYPALPGQPAYSFNWTPEFFTLSERGPSGVDVDLAISATGVHEFELTYQVLRDTFDDSGIEFKTIMGFWLRIGGPSGRFLFKNPSDNTVLSQIVATTDGVNSVYTLVRSFGLGENVGTEPVGYVDPVATFAAYLDGVWQSPGTYSVISTTPANQQIKFNTTPGAGKVITVDMSYYYFCKFADDKMIFEEFMNRLWGLKKITLRSVKAAGLAS